MTLRAPSAWSILARWILANLVGWAAGLTLGSLLILALSFGLWLSALNVRYRDVNYLIPFRLQIRMYATPVVFGATLIPERYRWLMALNPMTGVVEGFRRCLPGSILTVAKAPGLLTAVSAAISPVVLVTGVIFFRFTEKTFADII